VCIINDVILSPPQAERRIAFLVPMLQRGNVNFHASMKKVPGSLRIFGIMVSSNLLLSSLSADKVMVGNRMP
jgi:hypothetical protein